MKVAILSPIAWRTPPRHYGPWENVVSLLTEGLVERNIDITQFTFRNKIGDYLLYFGRIHHDKGTREAIEISKRAGMKLIIAGLIQDRYYYEKWIKSHIEVYNKICKDNSLLNKL
jgi:glycosyltransferase involved in cell wall biosynthesis